MSGVDRGTVEAGAVDPVWDRLTDQLAWYDAKSVGAQRCYKRLKLGQIAVGAAVPVVAGLAAPPYVTAVLAAVVVVAEGAQQLFQWQANWLLYRATAEALKREKHLYLAGVGVYEVAEPRTLLAERVEDILSRENATWTAAREPDKQREGH